MRRRYATPVSSYRSGLEELAATHIKAAGLPVFFERQLIPYTIPESHHTYKPDFILPNGVIIETKGLFQTDDRKKHKLLKEQHPDLDIRFVFSRAAQRIAKQSKTTYAKWAETLGRLWADRTIPDSWFREPPNRASLEALKGLGCQFV